MIFDWMPLIFTFMLPGSRRAVIYWRGTTCCRCAAELHHAPQRLKLSCSTISGPHSPRKRRRSYSYCLHPSSRRSARTSGDDNRCVIRARAASRASKDDHASSESLRMTTRHRCEADRTRAKTVRRRLAVLLGLALDRNPAADGGHGSRLAGRSNVGKSSLINALTGRNALARTSHTPGRTQELIFFEGPDNAASGWSTCPVTVRIRAEGQGCVMTALIHKFLQGRSNLARSMC